MWVKPGSTGTVVCVFRAEKQIPGFQMTLKVACWEPLRQDPWLNVC